MANEQQSKAGNSVVLRDRFLIYPGTPLADLNSPQAQAFHAEDRRDPNRGVFALIVRPGYPARLNALRTMRGLQNPGILQLWEWGSVFWPPANRKVMALVYEKPLGGRVMASLTTEFRRVDEGDLMRKVITPITGALKELRAHNLTHRAIRPTNLFWATAERDRVVLGDCCSTPPGFDQPILMETVESALAHPAGRGNGVPADDLYSLGASLIMLVLGRNPVATADDEAIIRHKIVHGSYSVLVGEERLPLATIELLRGLLCDDPHERWGTESLELWMSGRRLTPLLTKSEKRAARGFSFAGKDYFSARELAMGFVRHWDQAGAYIVDGRLELWLRRSLEQNEKANAIAVAVQSAALAAADKKPSGDVMIAKVCMILDGVAPVRYKTVSAMPDGVGWLLAMTMAEGGDVRVLAEMLMREAPKAWFETRDAYNPDNSVLESSFREEKSYLDRGTIGNGVERVLYEMNESMPCLSPLVAEDYVLDMRDVLPALNAFAARKGDPKGWPIDRHLAGFIGARSNFDLARQLHDLAEPGAEKSALAMLNLLALIQWRLGQRNLPPLTSWVGGLMQPVINSYHSRELRRDIEKQMPAVVREGSLVELSRLLDNMDNRAADMQGFEAARAEWADAEKEIRDIKAGVVDQDGELVVTAKQIAALVSVTISLLTVTFMVLKRLV